MSQGKLQQFRYNGGTNLQPVQPRAKPQYDFDRMLQAFLRGNTEAFNSPDSFEFVAENIFKLYRQGSMRETLILMEQLGEVAQNGPKEQRERALIILSMTAEKVLEEDNEDLLEAISQMLVRWLKTETEYLSGFEFVCLQLNKLIHKMLDSGLWYQAEDLVAVLRDIKKGVIEKNKLLKQIISRTHASIARDDCLSRLTECFLDENNDKSDVAGTLLMQLGDKSTPHLIKTLARSESRNERYRLLGLIPAAGGDAVPFLVDTLGGNQPWYVIRNLILLLAKIGSIDVYKAVRPHLEHPDIRVQQEAIDCIEAMNSDKKVARLLEAFELCNDRLKPKIIDILGHNDDKRIILVFVDLLDTVGKFETRLQNEIIQCICRHLDIHPLEKSFAALERLVADGEVRQNLEEETLSAIETACGSLRRKLGSGPLPDWVTPINTDAPQPLPEKPARSSQAKKTDIPATERDTDAPDWYLHVLNDDIPAPFRNHLLARKEFYTSLSHEEFLVFSALLTNEHGDRGDILVAEGDVHSTLYCIENGRIAVIAEDGNRVATLEAGDIFGHDIFMNGSEWNVTLKVELDSDIFCFDQEQLLSLQPTYPELCRKIIKYSKTPHSREEPPSDHEKTVLIQTTAEDTTETVPFTGDIGDHIADATVTRCNPHGLRFSFHLPAGIDPSLFENKQLYITISNGDDRQEVRGETASLDFHEDDNRHLFISVRFHGDLASADYTCHRISL